MITASRTLSPASLAPAIIRRRARRPLMLAPPAAYAKAPPLARADRPVAADRMADLRFFVGCYSSGLVFFLIMLS